MSQREFEIVLLGATGFTGRLTARWLAETVPDLRWALAGRTPEKLEDLRRELAEIDPRWEDLPLLRVDVDDAESIAAMVPRTRVVLSTAGPFRQYAPPVIAACVTHGTDFCDITGEPAYVAEMIRLHHPAAAANGTRIVSACGMDSIPFDIGAWYTAQQLPRTGPVRVRGYFKVRAAASGGTWASALQILGERGKTDLSGLRVSGSDKRARGLKTRVHHSPHGWAAPLPTIDPMIVLRSAQLLDYGPDFRYAHHYVTGSLFRLGRLGLGVGALAVAARSSRMRAWLETFRPSGAGPSEEAQASGWLGAWFHGEEGDRRVLVEVTVPMDPGYAFTARMCSAAALTLARDRDRLDKVGVVTTAAAMAAPLLDRLREAGMTCTAQDDPR